MTSGFSLIVAAVLAAVVAALLFPIPEEDTKEVEK
jgi:hypothetical protein